MQRAPAPTGMPHANGTGGTQKSGAPHSPGSSGGADESSKLMPTEPYLRKGGEAAQGSDLHDGTGATIKKPEGGTNEDGISVPRKGERYIEVMEGETF